MYHVAASWVPHVEARADARRSIPLALERGPRSTKNKIIDLSFTYIGSEKQATKHSACLYSSSKNNLKKTAVSSRISSKLIFASRVRYFSQIHNIIPGTMYTRNYSCLDRGRGAQWLGKKNTKLQTKKTRSLKKKLSRNKITSSTCVHIYVPTKLSHVAHSESSRSLSYHLKKKHTHLVQVQSRANG